MKSKVRKSTLSAGRIAAFCLLAAGLLTATVLTSTNNVSANHPVLVEGNCDSPVPGTTIVNIGQCGDYDGDGRIGTAEDTDGADRIFGTIAAALGPGTGAAAGTGANNNGTIQIVRSGRFAEQLFIGAKLNAAQVDGVTNPGNVTLEAAPGVAAIIDAVLQGDPAGGNTTRQGNVGITIYYVDSDRVVTLRNLTIRNWATGIFAFSNTNLHIDNCRLENNQNFGMNLAGQTHSVITNTSINGTGYRIPVTGPPAPGRGIFVDQQAQVKIVNSTITHNKEWGIFSVSPNPVILYKVGLFFNGAPLSGASSQCTDSAPCS